MRFTKSIPESFHGVVLVADRDEVVDFGTIFVVSEAIRVGFTAGAASEVDEGPKLMRSSAWVGMSSKWPLKWSMPRFFAAFKVPTY